MSYYRSYYGNERDLFSRYDITKELKGVFINSAYETNKPKCIEAYMDNFLYNDNLDAENTMARLKEICSSHMLPIKAIEQNQTNICNIKCEDYDTKVEIENTGPYSFNLSSEVFVLPPMSNQHIDLERLKIEIAPNRRFLKPILVPRFEIQNMYEDAIKSHESHMKKDEVSFSSLLFKTYKNIEKDFVSILLSGGQFIPCGYVVSKSIHEPINMKPAKVEPFQKCIIKVFRPSTMQFPDFVDIVLEND